ncbi:hypothetical protein ACLB2K_001342 [Fragaria x ananassa]
MIETQTGQKIKRLRSDNGGEYKSDPFFKLCQDEGIAKSFRQRPAVTYVGHLINRLPSAAIEGKTPMGVWSGKPATDYNYLHIFGCPTYFHVRESNLDPRAKKAIFLGFNDGVKGFKLWCPDVKKVVVSRDVTFDEGIMVYHLELKYPFTL